MEQQSENKGPIEILCGEIGASFIKRMENIPVLVAFVGVLVEEIEVMARTVNRVAHLTGESVPTETEEAFGLVKNMLNVSEREQLIESASKVHNTVYVDDEGPCNHYIDMLSSCISAIQFGLERPCRSRHAAAAANHIWSRKYGITLFDNHSNAWGKQWTKEKFYEALAVTVQE